MQIGEENDGVSGVRNRSAAVNCLVARVHGMHIDVAEGKNEERAAKGQDAAFVNALETGATGAAKFQKESQNFDGKRQDDNVEHEEERQAENVHGWHENHGGANQHECFPVHGIHVRQEIFCAAAKENVDVKGNGCQQRRQPEHAKNRRPGTGDAVQMPKIRRYEKKDEGKA